MDFRVHKTFFFYFFFTSNNEMIGSCTPLLPWIGQAEQKKMDEYFTLIIANGRICYFFLSLVI